MTMSEIIVSIYVTALRHIPVGFSSPFNGIELIVSFMPTIMKVGLHHASSC